jgi:hypothetical protein
MTTAVPVRARAQDGATLRHRRIWQRSAWVALFVLFLGIRAYHLDRAPAHNATVDEYAWTWSGMTLLQRGVPRAWSDLGAYAHRRKRIDWRGHDYRIVEPWLDHPPLYSLYAGGVMLAFGYREMFDVDLWYMRLGSLPLSAASFVLLALILQRLLAPAEALLSLLFYAVLPPIVLHQRLVVSENLFVPLTLGCLLLLLLQRECFSHLRAGAVLVLGALLPLSKVAALSSSVFLTLWALGSLSGRERWITTGALVLGTCLGVAGFIAYGRSLDAELFSAVLTSHQHRFRGFGALKILLFDPQLVDRSVQDLLTILGGVLALSSLSAARMSLWGLAVLVYAACMAFFADQLHVFGWYFIPLYPWLCAALGVSIARASRQRQLGLSLVWCTVAWLSVAQFLFARQLVSAEQARAGYLLGLLLIYGAWIAWPQLARATIPAVNASLVAAVTAVCLFDLYQR